MKQVIVIFVMFFVVTAKSQTVETYKYSGSGSAAVLEEYKTKTVKVKGVYYYNKDWKNADIIMFTGETLKKFPIKYNLGRNNVEVKNNNTVKIIPIGRIKEIHFYDKNGNIKEYLYNAVFYKNIEDPGFLSLLSKGKKTLMKKTYLEVIEPNYVNALDVGERDTQIVQRVKYYLINENNEAVQIKKSKRFIVKIFNDKSDEVKEYISQKKLKIKDEKSLIEIFNFYNNNL